jgi:hypothetical protein
MFVSIDGGGGNEELQVGRGSNYITSEIDTRPTSKIALIDSIALLVLCQE